jgi:anthranilate synthase/aminodeoxychorismate synthase-like glutamine amidotransferase
MILLIDNYDSFVFNLARYLRELGCQTEVVRNDAVTVEEVTRRRPEAIVLSPGPCTPAEAGICVDLVRTLAGATPILGVCLGHQAIAAAYGAAVVRAPEPVHGRTATVVHNRAGLFSGLPQPLTVGRYHSLIVDPATLPQELEVTCRTTDGLVMGLAHRQAPVFGVQFHPESVLTQAGHQLLRNFLSLAGRSTPPPPKPEWTPPSSEEEDFYRQPIYAGATPPW